MVTKGGDKKLPELKMKIRILLASCLLFLLPACDSEDSSGQGKSVVEDPMQTDLPDWIRVEDRRIIDLLVRSGVPIIERNSSQCGKVHPDSLGQGEDEHTLCVKSLDLTDQVAAEIGRGVKNRFVNLSDYDQRITQLFAFQHDGHLGQELAAGDLAALVKAFQIPVEADVWLPSEPKVSIATADSFGYLGFLHGLHNGFEDLAESPSITFASKLLDGAGTVTYTWKTMVFLYHGGGFTTGYHIVLTPKHLLFVKIEGWDA